MLKRLHSRHEVDYLTLDDGSCGAEGPARALEYCRRFYAAPHQVRSKSSPLFLSNLATSAFQELPLAVSRWRNREMCRVAEEWRAHNSYDAVVCDFLVPAVNLKHWSQIVLFQHNVEAQIWERHASLGDTVFHRCYLEGQRRKMERFEGKVCRLVKRVVAVSGQDAMALERRYGLREVPWVETGVDVQFFSNRDLTDAPDSDLIFVGSMDWLPNVDAARWLAREILPVIWQIRPETTISLVGRNPVAEIQKMASDARIRVSGTVPDVRPWLNRAKVAIVPLRIGGGTRLKIYEAMAAGVPVVSTSIGAEGLTLRPGDNCVLADGVQAFSEAVKALLENHSYRTSLGRNGQEFVSKNFAWESIAASFEKLLL